MRERHIAAPAGCIGASAADAAATCWCFLAGARVAATRGGSRGGA